MITVKHIDTIDGIQDLIFEQTYNETIGRKSGIPRSLPGADGRSFHAASGL